MSTWHVSGGAGGVRARYDDLLLVAASCAALAERLLHYVVRVRGVASDPALTLSIVASPGSGLRAERAVLHCVRVLASAAVESEILAVRLRAAVAAYRLADRASTLAVQQAEDAAGRLIGAAAPALVLPALTAVVIDRVVPGDGAAAVDHAVARHVGAAGVLAGGLAGITQGIGIWLPAPRIAGATYPAVLGSLAPWFPDGAPTAGLLGWSSDPADLQPPRTAGDLLRGVRRRATSTPGEIGVVRLRGADGRDRYVVQLPGTADWSLHGGPETRDLTGNITLSAGAQSAYAAGVVLALKAAKVPAAAPVLLVGHSQGGMVAAALAADPRVRNAFDIRCVLTAGAPLGRIPDAPGVEVLAVENTCDLVPELEGRRNADRTGRTTARFTSQSGSVGGNHDLGTYAAAADRLPERSPSVRHWQSAAAQFLDPAAVVTSERWAVTRVVDIRKR